MLEAFDLIARRRIEEAMERGEFDDLPGQGRPLDFSDEAHIPPEQRVAYRVLKNSGYVPEGVLLRRRLAELERRAPRAIPSRRRWC